jgi:hypothetical protein
MTGYRQGALIYEGKAKKVYVREVKSAGGEGNRWKIRYTNLLRK